MRAADNEGRWYHWTCENDVLKEELEMNGNDEMEWNESIEMEMDKSECDRSGWEEEWDGNGWIWKDIEHGCELEWKTEMCGDEGDGVEIGWKGGWNNE